MKFTEDEKDLLMTLSDSSYYAVLAKAVALIIEGQENTVLKQTDKDEMWQEMHQLKGMLKCQRELLTLLNDARKSIRRG